MFYGLPAQSLDLNCNLFMTFLSFAQNSFYDTNAVERNLSFCHKLVPNASVYNIQAVRGCVHCTTQRVQRWRVNPWSWDKKTNQRWKQHFGIATVKPKGRLSLCKCKTVCV